METESDMFRNSSVFKYRISNNALGRFFVVDPLYAKYPYNSQYAFSDNRVIDGVELEGLEFSKVETVEAGVAKIKIVVRINVTLDGITQEQAQPYKEALVEQFNRILSTASDESTIYSGSIIFDEKATISLAMSHGREDAGFVGMSGPGVYGNSNRNCNE